MIGATNNANILRSLVNYLTWLKKIQNKASDAVKISVKMSIDQLYKHEPSRMKQKKQPSENSLFLFFFVHIKQEYGTEH